MRERESERERGRESERKREGLGGEREGNKFNLKSDRKKAPYHQSFQLKTSRKRNNPSATNMKKHP